MTAFVLKITGSTEELEEHPQPVGGWTTEAIFDWLCLYAAQHQNEECGAR
jgi:hypothetical protein